MARSIYEMGLHEIVNTEFYSILRVAGGWIYSCIVYKTSVFVPWHNEFQSTIYKGAQMTAEQLASLFHSTYERLAPAFGWHTKKGCNVPFEQLPQCNRALMIATCQTVLNAFQEQGAAVNVPTTPPACNAAYPGTGPVVTGGTAGVA